MKSNKKKSMKQLKTANFTAFPLILCGNAPEGTKTMQTEKDGSKLKKKFFERRRNKKLTLSSYCKLRLETIIIGPQ